MVGPLQSADGAPPLYFSHPACLEHDPREQMPLAPRHARSACWRSSAARGARLARMGAAGGAGGDRGGAGARPHPPPASNPSATSAPPEAARSTPTPSSARPPFAPPCTPPAAPARWCGRCSPARPTRLLRSAALRPSRRTRPSDGLLPLRQRRDRRRAGDPRAGARAGDDPRLGRPSRQRHGRGVPRPRRRPRRRHPPAGHLPGPGGSPTSARGSRRGVHDQPACARRLRGGPLAVAARARDRRRWGRVRARLVLVSAGFDAHLDDPLADCRLEAASFACLACHVRDLAGSLGAPLGAVLEGGYDLAALAESVEATLPRSAARARPSRLPQTRFSPRGPHRTLAATGSSERRVGPCGGLLDAQSPTRFGRSHRRTPPTPTTTT